MAAGVQECSDFIYLFHFIMVSLLLCAPTIMDTLLPWQRRDAAQSRGDDSSAFSSFFLVHLKKEDRCHTLDINTHTTWRIRRHHFAVCLSQQVRCVQQARSLQRTRRTWHQTAIITACYPPDDLLHVMTLYTVGDGAAAAVWACACGKGGTRFIWVCVCVWEGDSCLVY